MDTDYLDLMKDAIAGIGWDGKSDLDPSQKNCRRVPGGSAAAEWR